MSAKSNTQLASGVLGLFSAQQEQLKIEKDQEEARLIIGFTHYKNLYKQNGISLMQVMLMKSFLEYLLDICKDLNRFEVMKRITLISNVSYI